MGSVITIEEHFFVFGRLIITTVISTLEEDPVNLAGASMHIVILRSACHCKHC